MSSKSTAWKLLAAVALIACPSFAQAQQTRQAQIKSDDAAYDQIVEDFIQFDIGNIRNPVAVERIKSRFNGLKSDDAVPALVRGLNRSTRMRASCPITALSGKLKAILGNSQNAELGTYVLENLELRDAGAYTSHVRGVYDAAEKQVVRVKTKAGAEQAFKRKATDDQQRLAHVPGMKLTDLAARDTAPARAAADDSEAVSRPNTSRATGSRPVNGRTPAIPTATVDPSKWSLDELSEHLKDRATQAKALGELNRRASQGDSQEVAEQADVIIKCLKDGDDAAREAAARLLGLLRTQQAVPTLIDALEDANVPVRSSAATALTRITRQLFGPNENATADEVKRSVARWREWWGRQARVVER